MNHSDFITTLLQEATDIANNNFGKVTGVTKGADNNQVLTETDLEIGTLLVGKIKKEYPNYSVIDEEAGVIDNKSEFTWVVDPIDGTSNFANGVPTYGVMIGLLQGATPIAGGVALPYFQEIYTAEKGSGAFCNGVKISVSQEEKLLHSLIAYGIDGHQENPALTHEETALLEKIILNCRNLRSSNSAFDFMMVAKGGYGGYLNKTSKIWDNVAPQIIIEEAGGIYTDFFGKEIEYINPLQKVSDNFTCCVGAPTLHKQLQEIIRE